MRSSDAGRFDKLFSDLLRPNVNEIHASDLRDEYILELLASTWNVYRRLEIVLLNASYRLRPGPPAAVQYGEAVIEAVKAALKLFRREVLNMQSIGNVSLILDANHHNCDEQCMSKLETARKEDGVFRAVNGISRLDSAGARLLQLTDLIAYSRKFLHERRFTAERLREVYGIRTQ